MYFIILQPNSQAARGKICSQCPDVTPFQWCHKEINYKTTRDILYSLQLESYHSIYIMIPAIQTRVWPVGHTAVLPRLCVYLQRLYMPPHLGLTFTFPDTYICTPCLGPVQTSSNAHLQSFMDWKNKVCGQHWAVILGDLRKLLCITSKHIIHR